MAKTPVEQTDVSYLVKNTVTVDGVEISPGKYGGNRVRLGTRVQGGTVNWQPWDYKIDPPGFGGLVCTEHVRSGTIKEV